jgi:hypothetical protein
MMAAIAARSAVHRAQTGEAAERFSSLDMLRLATSMATAPEPSLGEDALAIAGRLAKPYPTSSTLTTSEPPCRCKAGEGADSISSRIGTLQGRFYRWLPGAPARARR